MSMEMLGGADGPASIFLVGNLGLPWINIFGVIIMLLLLIPNIAYALKFRGQENKCTNKVMNILEQIGRYASMFLMVFDIGADYGFSSVGEFLVYGFGNMILLAAYWVVWILYFQRQKLWKAMALAIIPTGIFLLSGITLRYALLIVSAVLFGIAHTYVTYQNAKEQERESICQKK